MKIISLLFAVSIFLLPLSLKAQSCDENLKSANELRKDGMLTQDMTKLGKAIYMYRLVSACDLDSKGYCDRQIKSITKIIKSHKPDLVISTNEASIPAQGESRQIDVISNGEWSVESQAEWLEIKKTDENSFFVKSLNTNTNTRCRVATIYVKKGNVFRSIKIIQEASSEFIKVGAQDIFFPTSSADDIISIESNANWAISSVPDWCKVNKTSNGKGVNILVKPNDKAYDRTASITVYTPKESATITIHQVTGAEYLVATQNKLYFEPDGGECTTKIYSYTGNWELMNCPEWLHVKRIGKDMLNIRCDNNIGGVSRYVTMQIKANDKSIDIKVLQKPDISHE